mgnify:FL=1|jgi:hypothetical protein
MHLRKVPWSFPVGRALPRLLIQAWPWAVYLLPVAAEQRTWRTSTPVGKG